MIDTNRNNETRFSIKWDFRFMEVADLVATWSKDPSTKVGCVLVDQDRHIIATGYNGFPRGVDDSEDRLTDRPTKIMMVLHAEANAVLQAVGPIVGATAYVSHRPCSGCSAMLIQAGVKRIVTRTPSDGFAERFAESFRAADLMLNEAGVEIAYLATAVVA